MNSFCEMLPHRIKQLVVDHIFTTAAEKNSIFKDNLQEVKEFFKDLIPILHKPDDIIIKEGDKGRFFYFIAIGKCGVTFQ